jgi:hypothetical protein
LLVAPILIPGTLLWVLGLLLIAVAGMASGNHHWVLVAIGKGNNDA